MTNPAAIAIGYLLAVTLAACSADLTASPPTQESSASGGSSGQALGPRGAAGVGAAGIGGFTMDPAHLPDALRDGGILIGPGSLPAANADAPKATETPLPPGGSVVISELMYHPVLEDSVEDDHEFIEIANRSKMAVSLDGWKLSGDVQFAFPAGATVGPGAFRVVAKNRKKLAAVVSYGLRELDLWGDYAGQLDNGSGRIVLADAAGAVVDVVAYRSRFPWPHAPDGFGAGEAFLPAALLPLKKHQYLGHSLERVSLDAPSAEIANWVPSAVDAPSPAKANPAMALGSPPAVVESLTLAPGGADGGAQGATIRSKDQVSVTSRLSVRGTPKAVELEWFVDDLDRSDEKPTVVAMAAVPGQTATFSTTLPAQKDGSLVRYRVLADRGVGRERLAPRPSDPYEWFSYVVAPVVTTTGTPAPRIYQILIGMKEWSRMSTHIQAGMVPTNSCTPNPNWDDKVAAVFVYDGKAYDVRVRYMGSRWNRAEGVPIKRWTGPKPVMPINPAMPNVVAPFQALSWSVKFPRWSQFEGRDTMNLNKQVQSCPGMAQALGARLYAAAGIPAPQVFGFAKVMLNGQAYHYMMDIEHADEDMLKRHFAGAKGPLGDFIKANSGCACEEGPYGVSDGRALETNPKCPGITVDQRYAVTWERRTHEWKGPSETRSLLEDFAAARKNGVAAVRTFLTAQFDMPKVLSYYAIRNWAGAWDDAYHNYNLYRPVGGKWFLTPLDLDLEFGSVAFGGVVNNARCSFYLGTMAEPAAWGTWSVFEEAILSAFKTDYEKKLLELSGSGKLLDAAEVGKMLDQEAVKYNRAEANASPAPPACSVDAALTTIRQFIKDRPAAVASRIKG